MRFAGIVFRKNKDMLLLMEEKFYVMEKSAVKGDMQEGDLIYVHIII